MVNNVDLCISLCGCWIGFTCCLYELVWFMVYCLVFFGSCWGLCVVWLFVVCAVWFWACVVEIVYGGWVLF